MERLPDEILLFIFTFIPFVQQIALRVVSPRWNRLLLDNSLLKRVFLKRQRCEDHQLISIFAEASLLKEVSFLNSFNVEGYCLLHANLKNLAFLEFTGCAVGDDILQKVLRLCRNILKTLLLSGTRITTWCLEEMKRLKALEYISFPEENGFTKEGVIQILQNCPSLQILDCTEGYQFHNNEIMTIVKTNARLTELLVPFSFMDDAAVTLVVKLLENLTKICFCDTGVTAEGVRRIHTLRPQIDIC